MWDSPLYVVITINEKKKLLWTYNKVEFSQVRKIKLNAGRKEVESERSHVAPLEPDGTLPGKPQPCGDTQINRNGLN